MLSFGGPFAPSDDLSWFCIILQLVFDELLERAREKEEKEAKKRKRLTDDFLNLLYSIKVLYNGHQLIGAVIS